MSSAEHLGAAPSELTYSIHEIEPSRQGLACAARAGFDTQVLTGVFTADRKRAAKTGAAAALLELFDTVRSGGAGGS